MWEVEEVVTQETLVITACDLFLVTLQNLRHKVQKRQIFGTQADVSVLNTANCFRRLFTGSPSRLVAVGVAERLAGLDLGDTPALDGAAGWWKVRRVTVLTTLVTYG